MFETAELGRTLDKTTFERRARQLRTELLTVQERLKNAPLSVLLLVNGVDGAGKGDVVNVLHEWLDPRFLSSHAFGPANDDERSRPRWWRFWRVLPPQGRIAVLFGSWYTEPILDRVRKRVGKGEFFLELARIQATERMLADDGAVIVKLWFHLSKKQQREKFDAWKDKKEIRWRVSKQDEKNHAAYDRFRVVSERALYETNTGICPWHVVEGWDARYAKVRAGEVLLAALQERLARIDAASSASSASTATAKPVRAAASVKGAPIPATKHANILDSVDLTQKLSDAQYDKRLLLLQGALHRTVERMKAAKRSAVVVFEGWDAAGKGGAIRRLTAALDSRDYQVVPVAAPTDEERARHYLWRFWRHVPANGHLTIFDRSWYGRVLVERVEGFARPEEWQRAYNEITEMEEQLAENGTAVVKLWLHVSLDEQMKRFKERENIRYKKFKIGPDDYRNRAKWQGYVEAVHDMVGATSTEAAPWHLVAANDKRHARIAVLQHVIERLKQRRG
jgi:polyphosphate:AMP phosphotransferase